MSDVPPLVSYALLDSVGETSREHDARREYYAASTIKLAVAAALLFAIEAGELSLEQTVASTHTFKSRIPGAAAFDLALDPAERDPGMPQDGASVSLGWCFERMITVSSNEATNLIIEALGQPSPGGVRGLQAVRETCERLGVPGVRVTRLICDTAAKEAGFTHAASALDLARLMFAITNGQALASSSRDHLRRLLEAQRIPIIAQALPEGVVWGSKSGWDEGIRHDVAFIGSPGSRDYRVLAICTEGYSAAGAEKIIHALAHAALGVTQGSPALDGTRRPPVLP